MNPGTTFLINDELIESFPWYDFVNVSCFAIDWHDGRSPTVKMTVSSTSQPEHTAVFQLEKVTECILPEMGLRLLQFSHLILENVRSQQWEDVWYRIYDLNFGEPSFRFKSGHVQIQGSQHTSKSECEWL
ncbi:MAG TPA: hypothetical protein DCM07_26935 [Planctomycetaceae bacterium]|nr:hypothetical protein [Gimesia sp.]HAH48413.1 hypothetical protein [Planctomycetaceae bacterium]HBL46230.1 hypothetical protein [Planctomycetaceae bacterium]